MKLSAELPGDAKIVLLEQALAHVFEAFGGTLEKVEHLPAQRLPINVVVDRAMPADQALLLGAPLADAQGRLNAVRVENLGVAS